MAKLARFSDYSTGVTREINWSDSPTAAVGLTKCKLDVREAHSGGVEVPEVQSEAHL